MKAPKSIFVCAECEYESAKWLGKCPSCGAWNSFEEQTMTPEVKSAARVAPKEGARAVPIGELALPAYMRSGTGMGELDRVLGGGLVQGSVVLLSGEPGIGKSTLLLQISDTIAANNRVLYVSGEESCGQLKLRAERLGVASDSLYLLTETSVDGILSECERLSPDVIVVDSIQTVYSDRLTSAPGSISQVRESAMAFIALAKRTGCAVILVGHVNKEGGISGPKILEHMVDAVLYFEGDRRQAYRLIRAIKNRYGSTNEIGVFEMGDRGLSEVPNPSEMMLDGRPTDSPGNCAACVMEGSRPLIAEVQALVSKTAFPAPRRTCDGFDYNRMCLLLAVLEKRLNLRFSENDVYLNVAGGMRIDEPAADLAVALSLLSGITDRLVPERLIAFGELGLSGEVRAISHIDYRVKEAARLGFTQILLPARCVGKNLHIPDGVEVIGVRNLVDVIRVLSRKREDPPLIE
ncbi:MAG: DNA repair protein RadA [Clostridia bacterium]|nr:DNA repair protein RadA [Clostridia bacterium]